MPSTNISVLVLVGSPPASGKSTLGQEIANLLGLPFFQKDEFKELLANDLARDER